MLSTSGVSSKHELHRGFGKLGTKAQLSMATARTSANLMMGTRMGAALSSYGPFALKVCVALWITALLASVFVILKA
ncbi:hypothetical protein P9228_07510 [Mesorhizobium sp. WSM4898]|uniref:hypothetical protein n=1 Tax=Mesorhizobium sp. WSM4898 TaxID=3038544 RepID=UPI002415123D|nr:hypothetical protein [Mesorhizobium sp. WSM4898]MDG4906289.1 hypothetical protein [Mesorhizobium sp. WSM4898]